MPDDVGLDSVAIRVEISRFGTESQLIAFLKNKSPGKTSDLELDQVSFETSKATLQAPSQRQLRNIAELLRAYPSVTVRIRVYPDVVGNRSFNLKLAQRRANSIMRELARKGLNEPRVTVQSNKTARLMPSNVSEKGRTPNGQISLSVTENEK